MKKIFISMLALLLCLCMLSACDSIEEQKTEAPTAAPIPTSTSTSTSTNTSTNSSTPTEKETEQSKRFIDVPTNGFVERKNGQYPLGYKFAEDTIQPLLDLFNELDFIEGYPYDLLNGDYDFYGFKVTTEEHEASENYYTYDTYFDYFPKNNALIIADPLHYTILSDEQAEILEDIFAKGIYQGYH